MGGYERDPCAVRAGRHSAGLRGAAPDLGLRALRGADGGIDPPRARDGGGAGQEVLQRPRGLHARRRVHPRRVRGARVLGRRRVLRPWSRGRGRHRQGHGRVDRRGAAGMGPLAHGHPPIRPPVPLAELHASADDRGLLDLLRHQVPGGGAAGRPTASRLAGVRAAHAGRRQLRREVGLGARQLVRREHSRRARRPAPARLGRQALVACDRGRVHRSGRAGRADRPVVVREARRPRARARASSSTGCARTRSTERSARSSTRSS